nr:hypothetical protein [uncultured Selenomonas sp.]
MDTDERNAEKKAALNEEFYALIRETNRRIDAVVEKLRRENRMPPGLDNEPEEIKAINKEYDEKVRLLVERYKALDE